ncbi:hypothetical protein [Gracilibacillus massiliensis]|uniref:hypothetical protein n=1 Tax=Gracilibacillus massiliensis TaxID=1564956 RepID=UPI00071D5BE9|nr:hypothetical protein [Gracilibacillus massiliensis]
MSYFKNQLFGKGFVLLISFAMIFTLIGPSVSASTSATEKPNEELKEFNLSDIELSQSEEKFLNKVNSVGEFFKPNKKDDTLGISLTKEELINDYNFSEEE